MIASMSVRAQNRSAALGGLKVCDFSWVAAGPHVTKYLGDHGATVVRVESARHPCQTRTSPPFKDRKPGLNRSGLFAKLNPNKLSISLDLQNAAGVSVARRLVAWADVVVENFTSGTMDRLGLGYEDLTRIKPDIVMLSTSSQGSTGPRAAHPGLGIQLVALAGFTNLCGWADRAPVQPFGAYTDFIAPRFAASALLAALIHRHRTGKGQYIDVSQFESSIYYILPLLLDYSVNRRSHSRVGNLSPCAAPHGVFRCRGEDRWCAISVDSADQWQALGCALGSPTWTEDPKFATPEDRKRNEEELNARVEEWTITKSAEEVMVLLQSFGVAAGVVQDPKDLDEDPQLRFREQYWEMENSEVGIVKSEGEAFTLSKTPAKALLPPPCLGEHTEYVCTHLLGMSDREFVTLFEAHAFE